MTQKFLRDDGTFQPIASTGSSASGPITLITNTLGSDIAITAGTTTTGPSIAQGSTGIWYVSGSVTIKTSGTAGFFNAKLWDGTSIVASAQSNILSASAGITFTLSGVLSNPAGNLRLSVATSVAMAMVFSGSGYGADSTITAIRIG